MFKDKYGFMINLYVKLFAGVVSFLGITLTEFWWKAPIALVGVLQVPLTYFFLKRMGCKRFGSLCGSAFIAVLPLHIIQSRYLWGYEVLGTFFAVLAIWAFISFFEQPTLKRGFLSSFVLGLYFISHGYIMPFLPCLFFIIILASLPEKEKVLRGLIKDHDEKSISLFHGFLVLLRYLWEGIVLLLRRFVWFFPLLFMPLYFSSVKHIFITKGGIRRLGFYLLEGNFEEFLRVTGLPLVICYCLAIIVIIFSKRIRTKRAVLFLVCGIVYLVPLFFSGPVGFTEISGYMLVGSYFLILFSAAVFDEMANVNRKVSVFLVSIFLLGTLWGTVESLFGRDDWFDPTYVKVLNMRGAIFDPGSKAAGYIFRKYVSPSDKVLAMHKALDQQNFFYYFGRLTYAWRDTTAEAIIDKFLEY